MIIFYTKVIYQQMSFLLQSLFVKLLHVPLDYISTAVPFSAHAPICYFKNRNEPLLLLIKSLCFTIYVISIKIYICLRNFRTMMLKIQGSIVTLYKSSQRSTICWSATNDDDQRRFAIECVKVQNRQVRVS